MPAGRGCPASSIVDVEGHTSNIGVVFVCLLVFDLVGVFIGCVLSVFCVSCLLCFCVSVFCV